ncbi:hypothetical protein [Massilia eurypsychrophila]|nr:hypothetical protein [Massilia eurypsychrophila]
MLRRDKEAGGAPELMGKAWWRQRCSCVAAMHIASQPSQKRYGSAAAMATAPGCASFLPLFSTAWRGSSALAPSLQ